MLSVFLLVYGCGVDISKTGEAFGNWGTLDLDSISKWITQQGESTPLETSSPPGVQPPSERECTSDPDCVKLLSTKYCVGDYVHADKAKCNLQNYKCEPGLIEECDDYCQHGMCILRNGIDKSDEQFTCKPDQMVLDDRGVLGRDHSQCNVCEGNKLRAGKCNDDSSCSLISGARGWGLTIDCETNSRLSVCYGGRCVLPDNNQVCIQSPECPGHKPHCNEDGSRVMHEVCKDIPGDGTSDLYCVEETKDSCSITTDGYCVHYNEANSKEDEDELNQKPCQQNDAANNKTDQS